MFIGFNRAAVFALAAVVAAAPEGEVISDGESTSCPEGTTHHAVNFDQLTDTSVLTPGTFIDDQFVDGHGFHVSGVRIKNGKREQGNWARMLDQKDLDSGGKRKTNPHPDGACARGRPDPHSRKSKKCVAQNNVLIIHGDTIEDEPNGNSEGGYVEFVFDDPPSQISSVTFLDIEGYSGGRVSLFDSTGQPAKRKPIEGVASGENCTVDFSDEKDLPLIATVRIDLAGSGAVAKFEYCALSTTSDQTCPPGEEEIVIDFDTTANGESVPVGAFVANQWRGLDIFGQRRNINVFNNKNENARGGLDDGNWARIFDSSKPTPSNRHLGSPNENCPGCDSTSCPGSAKRNTQGFQAAGTTNCESQNNVLIIHEGDAGDLPNDSRSGGLIKFMFDPPITRFLSMQLLDFGDSFNQIRFFDSSHKVVLRRSFDGLGENTVMDVEFGYSSKAEQIKKVLLDFKNTGAVTAIRYCAPSGVPECIIDEITETEPLIEFNTTFWVDYEGQQTPFTDAENEQILPILTEVYNDVSSCDTLKFLTNVTVLESVLIEGEPDQDTRRQLQRSSIYSVRYWVAGLCSDCPADSQLYNDLTGGGRLLTPKLTSAEKFAIAYVEELNDAGFVNITSIEIRFDD